MWDVVTKESYVVQTSSFLDLSICRSGPRYTLLVPARVIDQFREDVLIEQLLDDALTSLCLLFLLLPSPAVRLLRVVATSISIVVSWICQDQLL